ncbi:hypothetical protein SCATT_07830 [Streptantibioticus cattleyicolor NRRL 8057 = DSM 46488]|uniref:Uncharacterized protein n=2 Tax=Kitasatosporales TaxID=85011 RepID=F8JV68_STREN|nr:hypothetical protein SCATT_07830 [Streptantibioticus cattleyicolor NRRL 8057 = DSM 46488]MYS57880.1 hypothetical protein [Streptomyces sp. SID5468]CCB73511.1 conserved exported protein of unknown function [Streptantibioticus cattleyicolor NRRL 8057 = DSM 46488]
MRWMPGMWRWRRNPLRRRSDLIEAWAGLATAVVVVVGAPVAGIAAGRSVGTELEHDARVEQAQRHRVTATVLRTADRSSPAVQTESVPGQQPLRLATIRWTAPDGTPRTGTVRVERRPAAGDTLPVWTDRHGVLTDRPLDSSAATANAVAAGLGAATTTAALACAARQALGWRLLRRRLADWERDWLRVSQDWGRTGAGG